MRLDTAYNVIKMPPRTAASVDKTVTLVLPFDHLDQVREALVRLEAAAQVGLTICAKAEQYSDAAAVEGIRDVFVALASLLT